MNEKKNLDRLFQEKFKDFEADPDEKVWKNIEALLKEKKKDRKVIPFWWRLSGVAAIFLLGFFAFQAIFSESGTLDHQIVLNGKKNPSDKTTDAIVNQPPSSTRKKSTQPIPEGSNPYGTIVQNYNRRNIQQHTNPIQNNNDKAIVSGTINKKQTGGSENTKHSNPAGSGLKTQRATIKLNSDIENALTVADKRKTSTKKSLNLNKINGQSAADKKSMDETDSRLTAANSKKDNGQNKSEVKSGTLSNGNTTTAELDLNKAYTNSTVKKDNPIETSPGADHKLAIANSASETIENKKLDSTAITAVVPNALEELLQKNEKEKDVAESKLNRWQVSSNVAPIYFSSTSNGSPIDSQFAGNDKSYENNLSVGVGVNYAVSKKISVRTGVNKFTLAYNTNDIVFFAGLESQSFANISPSSSSANLEIVSSDKAVAGLLPFEASLQNTSSGSINQKLGYIEIPMEMSYKIVDKKFGMTVIGGLSTLFLNENKVSLVTSNMSSSLGKANNLNDVHFSSNIGLGFEYHFLKTFEFNFEPMFKYQLNTFSNSAGNFKPYFIGLYTGLSFNF